MIGSGAGGLAACARRGTASAAAELTIKSRRDRVRGAFIGKESGKRSPRWEADCVRTSISAAASPPSRPNSKMFRGPKTSTPPSAALHEAFARGFEFGSFFGGEARHPGLGDLVEQCVDFRHRGIRLGGES